MKNTHPPEDNTLLDCTVSIPLEDWNKVPAKHKFYDGGL